MPESVPECGGACTQQGQDRLGQDRLGQDRRACGNHAGSSVGLGQHRGQRSLRSLSLQLLKSLQAKPQDPATAKNQETKVTL